MDTKVFSALADPTRRKILEELSAGPQSVTALVDSLGISQPTVSKHLKILKDSKAVSVRADGQKRFYTINKKTIGKAEAWLRSLTGKDETKTSSYRRGLLNEKINKVSQKITEEQGSVSSDQDETPATDFNDSPHTDDSLSEAEKNNHPSANITQAAQRAAKGASDLLSKFRKR